MLTPRKSRLFESVFAAYNRNLLRRRFSSFRIRGLENLSGGAERPRIIFANHSTWWDGLIAFEISRRAGLDAFVMMEERQLRRYPLFRYLGAFSIDPGDRRSAFRSLGFAADLLRDHPDRALWIFPQGEIRPPLRRPLGFRNGIAEIVRRIPSAAVVPLAIRCEFGGDFKPEICAETGSPVDLQATLPGPRGSITEVLETALTDLLDGLERDIAGSTLEGHTDLLNRS